MKIVIYALGTSGDIDPMVALGSELIRRNYPVSFLSSDHFKPTIMAAGCDFLSVGTCEQYQRGNSSSAWEINNHTDNFTYYHAPAFEPAFEYMKAISAKNTLLLTLGEQNGAQAAAEKFNIPFVKIILSPNIIFSAINPPAPMCWAIPSFLPRMLTRFLLRRHHKVKFKRFCSAPHVATYKAMRKRLGCPLTYQKASKALLQIGLFPEWFGMPPKDWPANLMLAGFPLQNSANKDARLSFDAFIHQWGAPLVFTTGTGVQDVTEMFYEGRRVCELLKVPGVFVGGSQGAEILVGGDFCAHMKYIDFEYALPKALAIIHHGGIGTTAQAIKAKIPQLIRPLKYDQPDNADRIYKLGLGTYVMPERFKAEEVAPIIAAMLQRAKSSQALHHYGADICSSSAIIDACDLVEQVCRDIEKGISKNALFPR